MGSMRSIKPPLEPESHNHPGLTRRPTIGLLVPKIPHQRELRPKCDNFIWKTPEDQRAIDIVSGGAE